MIFVKSNKFIEINAPKIEVGVEGWYTLRAIRGGVITRERSFRVDVIRQAGPFHNLITDLGMNRLASAVASVVYARCHVGTGTATPATTDTQLSNFLASVVNSSPSTSNGNSGSPDFFSWRRFTWTSAIGALGTVNITEVGVSGQNTNGLLFSRELIRDSGGSPTSFPITSDEQLQVTYELRIYPPQSDSLATVSVSASSHDTTTRALDVSSGWFILTPGSSSPNFSAGSEGIQSAYSGDLVAITGSAPSGSLGNSTSVANGSYVDGNFYRDLAATWGTSTGNGNIRTIRFAWQCCMFQVRYDPVIVKTGSQQLILNQRVSWARA